MLVLQQIANSFAAVGFVLSLAVVGAASHVSVDKTSAMPRLLNGEWQAVYDEGFDAGNPLSGAAASTLGAVTYAVFKQALHGAVVGHQDWLFTSEEFEISAEFNTQVVASARFVAEVHAEMAVRGITLLPVLVPDKAHVHADMLRHPRPPQAEARHDRFVELLAQAGVTVIDVTPALFEARQTADSFMRTDTHWSPAGSRAAAKAVADAAARLPPAITQTTVSTTQVADTSFEGDLIAFAPTGALRAWVGPAPERISQFETVVEPTGDLFDAPALEVALVGTSFSARPDWHFEGFLKQALQTDLVSFAQAGRGPFAPMKDFMVSDFYQHTPPKLVVWEIPTRYTSKDLNQ